MLVTCSTCGAPNQEIGKFCEQCGAKITAPAAADAVGAAALNGNGTPDNAVQVDALPAPDAAAENDGAPLDAVPDTPAAPDAGDAGAPLEPRATADPMPAIPPAAPDDGTTTTGKIRFVRVENGVENPAQSFVVPVGSRMLIGRTDPANGVFPDVDVTMWSQRVVTPDGPLYTVHRKQCFVSRDQSGNLWIVDYKEYIGDTMVSVAGSGQFRTIPALAAERETNAEGGVRLQLGDRILMGQAEGMLIFAVTQED